MEAIVSCAALVKNWYFNVTSRLPRPLSVLPFGAGSKRFHSPPSVMPKFGKMRLENSPEMLVNWPACPSLSPGCLMCRMVGSESSSATNGSSMVSVEGKKRWPAMPCAAASVGHAASVTRAARAVKRQCVRISILLGQTLKRDRHAEALAHVYREALGEAGLAGEQARGGRCPAAVRIGPRGARHVAHREEQEPGIHGGWTNDRKHIHESGGGVRRSRRNVTRLLGICTGRPVIAFAVVRVLLV